MAGLECERPNHLSYQTADPIERCAELANALAHYHCLPSNARTFWMHGKSTLAKSNSATLLSCPQHTSRSSSKRTAETAARGPCRWLISRPSLMSHTAHAPGSVGALGQMNMLTLP